MAPNTGHVIDLAVHGKPDGYQVLPDRLQGSARRFLDGRSSAYVSLDSGGKLSRFARSERKKSRAQMARNSRRRNRH